MTDATPVEPTRAARHRDAGDSPKRRGSRGVWLFLRDILFILVAALVISFVIKTFLIRSFYIPSQSMENTLQINDRVIVSLLSRISFRCSAATSSCSPTRADGCDAGDTPARSRSHRSTDVLAFLGLAAPDDNNHLIKRVIGLARRSREVLQRRGPAHGKRRAACRAVHRPAGGRDARRSVRLQRRCAQGRHLGHGRQSRRVGRLGLPRVRTRTRRRSFRSAMSRARRS